LEGIVMEETGRMVFGVLAVLFGLLGLVLASRAVDLPMYWTGLALFAGAVLFVFNLIRGPSPNR